MGWRGRHLAPHQLQGVKDDILISAQINETGYTEETQVCGGKL